MERKKINQHLKVKVGHLQPIYLCLSRLSGSLGELQVVWPEKTCQTRVTSISSVSTGLVKVESDAKQLVKCDFDPLAGKYY